MKLSEEESRKKILGGIEIVHHLLRALSITVYELHAERLTRPNLYYVGHIVESMAADILDIQKRLLDTRGEDQ